MIRKAVILAAGYGTRFLPVTKAMPKEMLPVVGKPVIQYVVEDAVAAGVQDVVVVTSAQKRAIEDHFDYSFELETVLENGGKTKLRDEVRQIADLANFIYIRQKGAKGTMPAISCGYEAVGNEPFLAIWGDDFFIASPTRCQQLVAAYEKYQAPILGAIETTDPDHANRYGFVTGEEVEPGVVKVEKIVEKPGPGKAPSTYATVSGFVATPELMAYGSQIEPYPNGEFGYTAAIEKMLEDGKPVYCIRINNGTYYDCGNKLDYLKTNIELALDNEDMRDELRDYLMQLLAHKKEQLPIRTEAAENRVVSS